MDVNILVWSWQLLAGCWMLHFVLVLLNWKTFTKCCAPGVKGLAGTGSVLQDSGSVGPQGWLLREAARSSPWFWWSQSQLVPRWTWHWLGLNSSVMDGSTSGTTQLRKWRRAEQKLQLQPQKRVAMWQE